MIGETTTKVKEKAGCREEGWSRICRIGKGEDSLFKRAMLALSLGLEDEISGSPGRTPRIWLFVLCSSKKEGTEWLTENLVKLPDLAIRWGIARRIHRF